MGLSVASLRPITAYTGVSGARSVSGSSQVQQKSMNYSLENESDVSGAYAESLQQATPARVDAVPPVRYANATLDRVDPAQRMSMSQQVNRAYNNVASRFGGTTTGYGQDRAARAYGMVGQSVDLFA